MKLRMFPLTHRPQVSGQQEGQEEASVLEVAALSLYHTTDAGCPGTRWPGCKGLSAMAETTTGFPSVVAWVRELQRTHHTLCRGVSKPRTRPWKVGVLRPAGLQEVLPESPIPLQLGCQGCFALLGESAPAVSEAPLSPQPAGAPGSPLDPDTRP